MKEAACTGCFAGCSEFDVQEASKLTGKPWALCSRGLVGYLPLDERRALRIAPKVPIGSLLAMLDLAPDLDSLAWRDGITADSTVDGLFDVLARLLARRVANRVRKGLHRAYIEERDELETARGRILPRETLARRLRGATALVCDFETLTEDRIDNQILLFTLWMPKLFESYVARWLARELEGVLVDEHVDIALGSGLTYDADLVLRDPATRRPLAVIDTKYKDSDKPAPGDVQQVVFYATAPGCTEALLLYPRPVMSIHVQAGPVHVRTLGIDLEKLPAVDPAPIRGWAAGL